jgi:D-alanine transaminase
VARNRVRDGLVYIQISRGVTRSRLLELAQRLGFSFQERPFSLEEAFRAREAFFSSATTIAMPVVAIDGRMIGDGRPGRLTLALRRAFRDFASRT